jgi:hypothetical protein
MRTIFVPTANATEEFGGIVDVVADAFEYVTPPPLSASTSVSDVDVTVRSVSALKAVLRLLAVRTAPAEKLTMMLLP